MAACRQRRRVRFTTATALVNELAEAAHANQLSRALGRWERLDLICIDELGYVPLAETACELMFQVIADRAEKAAVIITTNLPFSEWSQVIPNPRLCKALIDRLTDRTHTITTVTDLYRFRRTTVLRKAGESVKKRAKKACWATYQTRPVGQHSSALLPQNSWSQPLTHVVGWSMSNTMQRDTNKNTEELIACAGLIP